MSRRIRFTAAAEDDIVAILQWSQEHFGNDAADHYRSLIATAVRDIADSDTLESLARPELGEGVHAWHLRRSRSDSDVRRPRHVVFFRREVGVVVIGRVLHESMDLARHLEEMSWD